MLISDVSLEHCTDIDTGGDFVSNSSTAQQYQTDTATRKLIDQIEAKNSGAH
jgi:hypothetical protein